MKRWRQLLLFGVAVSVGAWLAGAALAAEPQTIKLELVRLEPVGRGSNMTPELYKFRNVSPQQFFWQLSEGASYMQPSEQEFKKVVKKDRDKYDAKRPLRGVATFGSQKFAFVLDQREEAKKEQKETQKDKAKGKEPAKRAAKKSNAYDRLYLDLNGNGDLTDDKPIDAKVSRLPIVNASYHQSQFPRIDLTIDVDGKKLDYSFFLEVTSYGAGDGQYVFATLTAAAYRRGQVILDGKKWKIALLDHNSNGRFDDITSVNKEMRGSEGQLYPDFGDALVLEDAVPAPAKRTRGAFAAEDQEYLGKINNLGGKLYELKVTPRGDELTVTRSTVALGKVSSPHRPCTLALIGDQGYLSLSLDKSGVAEIPAGKWRLLSYTVGIENWQPPAKSGEKRQAEGDKNKKQKAGEKKKKSALWSAVQDVLLGTSSSPFVFDEPLYGRATLSQVSAQGTNRGKPIVVEAGKTTALKFGAPYKLAAELNYIRNGKAELSLAITGEDGEVVSSLFVNGRRPKKPKIEITGPDGKVVAQGDFEYG